jgi:putative ABC transport system ATP-binding protein
MASKDGAMAKQGTVVKQDGHAIALRDVQVTLGAAAARVHVLRGIDLNIGHGEAVGIVGPSGSGKSTLLMVMAGLEQAESGSVSVIGQELSQLSEDALARFRGGHVGVVFQAFHLIPTMTALENVAIPLDLAGALDAERKARDELALVGLADRAGHYPAQLSGGEQQRVALARALVGQPDILFADEPTGNLDGVTGVQIADLIFDLQAERGSTLVLVTHDETLAQRCGRVVRMSDGLIQSDGPGLASPASLKAAS